MTKSMTAYGRATVSTSQGQWVFEIHSVNRKLLDITIFMPKELLRFDTEIRKWIGEAVLRGQITVKIHAPKEAAMQGSIDELRELKSFWEKAAVQLGFPAQEVDLSFLTEQMRLMPTQALVSDEKEMLNLLQKGIEGALKELAAMKLIEGQALKLDVSGRLKAIAKSLEKIGGRGSEGIQKYRSKLEEKIKEWAIVTEELKTRLAQEVLFLMEKTDITEEMTRMRSHIDQFFNLLDSKEKSIGRTLDFLSQELIREINTISSKSIDVEIAQEVIFVKSEIEKIREQVQNIE